MTTPRPSATDVDVAAGRIRAGDVAAFERLFMEHHALLCEIADAYVDSQAIAEEIVQDLFYAVWKARATLHVRESMRSYLCTAVRNRAMSHLRHRAVVANWARRSAGEAHADPSRRSAPRADANMQREETLAALRDAVARLPARARLAVVLRWRHQLPNAEVAASMGISVKGVEKLLGSAMRRLRERVESHREGG